VPTGSISVTVRAPVSIALAAGMSPTRARTARPNPRGAQPPDAVPEVKALGTLGIGATSRADDAADP